MTCDYCGFKSKSIRELDNHIEEYHKIKSRGQSSRKHQDERTEISLSTHRGPVKSYTFHEQLQYGPCHDWNQGVCKYEDLCKYAHIEICRFQEHCRNPRKCNFFHFNHSNLDFFRKQFIQKDIPS